MKKFIYALLRLNTSAKKKLDGLDRRLWRTASYVFGDTWAQIGAMLDIIEAKQRIQSAIELADELRKGLTEEELDMLEMRAKGISCVEIAKTYYCCPKTAYRKVEAALKTAENVLFLLGYDKNAVKDVLREFINVNETVESEDLAVA